MALLLLQFGLLALVALSAVASQDLAKANRQARAHALARRRVEMLRAIPCTAPSAGHSQWPGGLEEAWEVKAIGSTRLIIESVDMQLPRGRRASHMLRVWMLCPP